MVTELTLTFPKFITHVPKSKNKWTKIGYNAIHASAHYTVRAAFVAAMHKYIENNIPENLDITGPVETSLIIYAPINYGNVRRLKNKKTGKFYLSWKPPFAGYSPNWDLFNLAAVWLKSLDDVLIKKGIIPEDTVEYLKKTSYEYIETDTLEERKLVYKIKTIKNERKL